MIAKFLYISQSVPQSGLMFYWHYHLVALIHKFDILLFNYISGHSDIH